MKTRIPKDTCTCMFIVAVFTIPKMQEQPMYPSIDKWINIKWYIFMDYHSAIKHSAILMFATMCCWT